MLENIWTLMLLGIINWYKVYEKKFDNRDQEHFRSYTPWQVILLLRIHSKKIIRDVFNSFVAKPRRIMLY